MDSLGEAERYLSQLDRSLGEHDLELSGVLVGQVALWEYADAAEIDVTTRDTDDVDIYTPDVMTAFELADHYRATPQVTGTRLEMDGANGGSYIDLLWDHGLAEELSAFLDTAQEAGDAYRLDYDNLDLYVVPTELFRKDKRKNLPQESRTSKEEQDLSTLDYLVANDPDLAETFRGSYVVEQPR